MSTAKNNNSVGEIEPIANGRGASILGPRNPSIESANPDLLISPYTDAGTLPNLKFPFAQARNRVLTGGWAREVTARELPASQELAAVNMRLKPGGIREMHWHKEAEWSYMLAGSARITAVDPDGRNFVDDVGVGDLWFFPAGTPHSIQGLESGCEFLLVFDDGNFSENETFLISDWFARTAPRGAGRQFRGPEVRVREPPARLRARTLHLRCGVATLARAGPDLRAPPVNRNSASVTVCSSRSRSPVPEGRCGSRTRATSPFSKTIAAALVEVEPGGMREMHWHPNGDEWQYYIAGSARMTVFASSGKARTFDYQAGDVGVRPLAMGHYVQNTGEGKLTYLEVFRSDHFADVSLNQWMALTPPELVRAHLNIDEETIAALHKNKQVVVR